MNTKVMVWMIAMVLSAPTAILAQSATPSQNSNDRASYRVHDLGTLGGISSAGNSINDLEWVTGTANVAGDTAGHATLWAYGLKIDLGTLGGLNSAIAWPLKNNSGLLAGFAETADLNPLGERWSCASFFPTPPTFHNCLGFVEQGGVKTALPTLGGYNGYAAGANEKNQIVGWAETTFHDPTCVGFQVLQFLPVIYGPRRGQIQPLPTYPGDPDGAATAINDKGDVVGISGTCYKAVGSFSAKHAVLWHKGVVSDLGNLGGVAWNTPTAINSRGQVVGFADLPGDQDGSPNFHAFLWTKETGMQDLHTLPGDAISEALGMNQRGQIVGVSFAAGFANPRAVLWQNGVPVDLNTLISSGSPLYLLSANDINDEGEITGQACVLIDGACAADSETPAFLAIPSHDRDGDDLNSALAQPTASTPFRVIVPERIRQQIIQRHGLNQQ